MSCERHVDVFKFYNSFDKRKEFFVVLQQVIKRIKINFNFFKEISHWVRSSNENFLIYRRT